MPVLEEKPTLADLQEYVAGIEVERKFTNRDLDEICLNLVEEVGELFKAIRKQSGRVVDPSSKVGAIDQELADILMFMLAIANRLGIDLEDALRKKEEVNAMRVWE